MKISHLRLYSSLMSAASPARARRGRAEGRAAAGAAASAVAPSRPRPRPQWATPRSRRAARCTARRRRRRRDRRTARPSASRRRAAPPAPPRAPPPPPAPPPNRDGRGAERDRRDGRDAEQHVYKKRAVGARAPCSRGGSADHVAQPHERLLLLDVRDGCARRVVVERLVPPLELDCRPSSPAQEVRAQKARPTRGLHIIVSRRLRVSGLRDYAGLLAELNIKPGGDAARHGARRFAQSGARCPPRRHSGPKRPEAAFPAPPLRYQRLPLTYRTRHRSPGPSERAPIPLPPSAYLSSTAGSARG